MAIQSLSNKKIHEGAASLKELSHHTTGSTSSNSLDGVQVSMNQLIHMLQHLVLLLLREGIESFCRHEHELPLLAVLDALQLQHVAAELVDLLAGDVDDLMRFAERLDEISAFVGVGDRFQADDRHGGSDAHHHVGVVDRPAFVICAVERAELVTQPIKHHRERERERCKNMLMSDCIGGLPLSPIDSNSSAASLGECNIGDFADSVHNKHTFMQNYQVLIYSGEGKLTCALKEFREVAVLPLSEAHLTVVGGDQIGDDVLSPFGSSRLRFHGIECNKG